MQIRYPEWKKFGSGMEKIRNGISVGKGHSSLTKHDGKSNRKKTVNETSINAVKKGSGKEKLNAGSSTMVPPTQNLL
jgi:hypothetical protein